MAESRRAAIDLGTNTCLLLVADWPRGEPAPHRVLHDEATVVRLGQGVDKNRTLHPDAKARTLSCLRRYAEVVTQMGISPGTVRAVATSQARDAQDGREFFSQIERETGIRFDTLSGEQEARLTFEGALLPGMRAESSAVIDIGGGSTEITTNQGGLSVDMGSVRFTERYLITDPDLAVTDTQFWACREAIDQALKAFRVNAAHYQKRTLVAVAGTATTLAGWHLGLKKFDAAAIDGTVLTRGDLHRLVEELKWRNAHERAQIPGVEPARADVLLAGAMILWRAHECLGFSQCQVSTRGLRFGVLKG